jgi:hypothetical protein
MELQPFTEQYKQGINFITMFEFTSQTIKRNLKLRKYISYEYDMEV